MHAILGKFISFYPEERAANQLRYFRFFFCGSFFLIFASKIHLDANFHAPHPSLTPLASLLFQWLPFSPPLLTLIHIFLALGFACCALAERMARPALIATFSLFLIYGSAWLSTDFHYQMYGHTNRMFDAVCPVLFLLILTPGTLRPVKEEEGQLNSWSIFLIQLSLALIFFGSGFAKLTKGGSDWASGESLRSYMLMVYAMKNWYPPFALAHYEKLCFFMAIFTLLFQCFSPFLILNKAGTRLFLFGALFFHFGSEVVMKVHFLFPFFFPIYFIFVDFPALARIPLFRKWMGRESFSAV